MTAPDAPSAARARPSGGYAPLVTPETARADLAAAVRLALLRVPALTVAQLAADAGIGERRLGRLLEAGFDRRFPRLDEALSLWAALAARDPALGAAAASASLDRTGLRAEVDDATPEPLAEALADVLDEAGELARAAAHGGVCRSNAAAIQQAGEALIEQGRRVRRAGREAGR